MIALCLQASDFAGRYKPVVSLPDMSLCLVTTHSRVPAPAGIAVSGSCPLHGAS